MPKTKSLEKTIEKSSEKKISKSLDDLEKIIEIPIEDGLELIPGEMTEEDSEEEDEAVLDEEEIDPFKDKWEE